MLSDEQIANYETFAEEHDEVSCDVLIDVLARCRGKDMRQLVWLDLCSGLGGASQPALDRGWRVIRVDIDPLFKPDIVADVRALPLKPFHVDVLWASPPCIELGFRWIWDHPHEIPDLSIANAVKNTIELWRPGCWVVENVHVAPRWLCPIFGKTTARDLSHVYWGTYGALLPKIEVRKERMRKDAAERARIPYEIGEAICRAVEARVSDIPSRRAASKTNLSSTTPANSRP